MHVLDKPEAGVVIQPASSVATRDYWRGLRMFAEPRLALASLAALFLGACAAWHAGGVAWFWLLITAVGVWFIEIAKNAAGEIFDWDSGVDLAALPEDRSPFAGGQRVLTQGLLTPGQTWLIAMEGYLLAVTAGVWIVLVREPRVLGLGLAGMILAFFYHAPPLRLSYRGLGETAVALAYGPMMCAGVFLVQHGAPPPWVVAVGVPLGLLVAAFQAVNEFPEFGEDLAAHKRTLVVRLGRPRAARVVAGLMAAAFALTLALPLTGAPLAACLGLVAVLPAAQAIRHVLDHPDDGAQLGSAQANAERAFLLYALGAGVGVALS